MKKYLLKISLVAALFVFVACDSSKDEQWIEPQFDTEGAFILNEGADLTVGDGSLTYYDPIKDKATANVFLNQNGIKLGALPTDILVYNGKMFITVTYSDQVFVTDLTGKLLENGNIDLDKKEYSKPRHIVAMEDKVYINFYSGHLIQMDSHTLEIEKVIEIEKNSEQMTIANNKNLYIADAGAGEGRTVTVVDLINFKKGTTINVPLNPNRMVSDHLGNIYVASWGKTWGPEAEQIPTELFRIDTKDNNKVYSIKKNVATHMSLLDEKLLLAHVEYEGDINHTTYSYYDIYTKKHIDTPFFTMPKSEEEDEEEVEEGEKSASRKNQINHEAYLDKAHSISVDPLKKDIYITTSQYTTRGGVYVFSKNGNYKTSFNSEGINPNKVVFVTKQVN